MFNLIWLASTDGTAEESRDYLNRNYIEMENMRGMSIDQLGRIYRVTLTEMDIGAYDSLSLQATLATGS